MPKAKPEPGVFLSYTGSDAGNPFIAGVAARDLTEAEVDFLAVRRGTTTADLIEELTAGPYRHATPATPAPEPEG